MTEKYLKQFKYSIQLELSVSEYYRMMSNIFEEDRSFWWGLCLEEKNHAALLKNGRDYFMGRDIFPVEILDSDISSLQKSIQNVEQAAQLLGESKLSKPEAYRHALEFEESSGEHFFKLITESTDLSPKISFVNKLIGEDKDHAKKIRELLDK
ncbi:hypothetical protein ACFLS1_05605 [Verrucomicrobiota bacterium]